jgi:hypothetical protein
MALVLFGLEILIILRIGEERIMMEPIFKGFTLVELAEQALTKPEDFGWWGREEMFNTWGWAGIDKNNSSNVLDECNFDVIVKDLASRYPDDFDVVGLKHWAVGHVDRLTVRILNEPGDIAEDNISEPFKECIEWLISLDEYPVADDAQFDDYCWVYALDNITDFMPSEIYIKDSKQDTAALILNEMVEAYDGTYDGLDYQTLALENMSVSDDAIRYVAYDLGLCAADERDYWDEWVEEQGLPPIVWGDNWGINPRVANEIDGQLELPFESE